jgi:hypothetical protein
MASNPKTAGESSKFMWVKQCHIPSPSHHHSSRWYDAPIPSHESLPGLDGNNLVASPEKNNPSDGLIVVLWCLAGRDICWKPMGFGQKWSQACELPFFVPGKGELA